MTTLTPHRDAPAIGDTRLLIDGERVDAVDGATLDVVNPATGAVLTTAAGQR
jgi:acyl-CoA reductase-like NAD-dependent aldehyde dehydrogenase